MHPHHTSTDALGMSLKQSPNAISVREAALLRSCAALIDFESAPHGRLRHMRDYVCHNRLAPTSAELRSQFLAEPGSWPTWDSSSPTPAKVAGLTDRWLQGARRFDSEVSRLQDLCLNSGWLAVVLAVPSDNSIRSELLASLCSTVFDEAYPLPVVRLSQRGKRGAQDYLLAITPTAIGEALCDWHFGHSTMTLDFGAIATFEELSQRTLSGAEVVLSLPNDFADMPPARACRDLAVLLARLVAPNSAPTEPVRVAPASHRARLSWADEERERAAPWGGCATIAFPASAMPTLSSLFRGNPRYNGHDAVAFLIDLLGATRIDPQSRHQLSPEWPVYQARWGYYFTGYQDGVNKALDLLVRHGAVVTGIFLPLGAAHKPEPATEAYTAAGRLQTVQLSPGPDYESLSSYLEDQRRWMGAYDMGPIAPMLSDIPAIPGKLPSPS